MRSKVGHLVLAVTLTCLPHTICAQAHTDASRIVCLGGTLTEIVFALGAGDAVIGVDSSSTFPVAATHLPQVGYQRHVAAEGILSLRPTLVLATSDAGPPTALQQLRDAGIHLVVLESPLSVDATKQTIRAVAQVIGRTAQAPALLAVIDSELQALPGHEGAKPRVLFVYARGAGTLLVAGHETAADEMIRLAGGSNAIQEIQGFKPLTAESVVSAVPDVILVPTQGIDSLGGRSGLLQIPGIALTPAAKQGRIVALDDLYLLGFGPRVGHAARDLARLLRPTKGTQAPRAAAAPPGSGE